MLVGNVVDGSPAAQAGIRAGDVMLTFDGHPTDARFEEEIYPIANMVARTGIGKTVDVVLLRRKERMTMRLTTESLGQAVGDDFEAEAWGLTVKEITKSMARMLALADDLGVLATGTLSESVGAKSGLRNRDVIREVAGTAVRDLDHFKEIYAKLMKEEPRKVVLKIVRDGRTPRLLVLNLAAASRVESGEDAR